MLWRRANSKNSIYAIAEWQWDGEVFISLHLAAPALDASSVSKGCGTANSPGSEQWRTQRWQEGGEPVHGENQLIMHGNGLRLCTVQAVPSGALGDSTSHVVDKDGKSSTEAQSNRSGECQEEHQPAASRAASPDTVCCWLQHFQLARFAHMPWRHTS